MSSIFVKQNKTRTIINWCYVILSLMFFATLWGLKIAEDTHKIAYHIWAVKILVPGYAGITMLYALIGYKKEKKLQIFIIIALFFAMIAESVNASGSDFGLLFFAITHTCLTIYHWKSCKVSKKFEIWSFVGVFFVTAIVITMIELYINTDVSHGTLIEYRITVPAYMIVLSTMLWRSFCTWGEKNGWRIIIGSSLFYICDVFILAEMTNPNFSNPELYMLILSWITYLPSLFYLSLIDQPIFILKKK